MYQEDEKRLQEENAQLKEELSQAREKEKQLLACYAMAEELKEKAKQDYVRVFSANLNLKKDLELLWEGYQDLEDSIVEGTEEVFRVLKEHVRVITPDLDLSPLHTDKIIINGKIVSPPRPKTDSELKTAGQHIIESPLVKSNCRVLLQLPRWFQLLMPKRFLRSPRLLQPSRSPLLAMTRTL
ncbi:uncharacterized protein DS421_18g632210 [Arachis hypogaea]|nr:uncharacterized protein DS421_18g632210 [Arachis hypogaea]